MKGIKIFLVVIISIFIISIIFIFFTLNKTTIYDGVRINDIEVGGLDRNEAITYITDIKEQELRDLQLKLVYKDYHYTVDYTDVGITYDYYDAVDKALSVGREGSWFKRLREIIKVRFNGFNIKMEIEFDNEMLYRLINKVSNDLKQKSKNAEIRYIKGKFEITPEVVGRKVNNELLRKRIINAVLTKDNVHIPVEEDIPPITEAKLKEIKEPLGSFSTSFYGSSLGRINNIKLSTEAINRTVLLPGELFSFNETTGERDKEAGYKEAKVILNGEYVDEIGGGVCQVSTTLYNAVLLSDLEIVERYPHSIPSTYVAKGRDATVVYGYLDLKFRNNTKSPIYIHAITSNNNLSITIFGNKPDKNRTIKIESVVTEKIPPETDINIDSSLSPGEKIVVQKGRYGYKVKTYKIIFEKGKVINRQLISHDFYKPRKEIVKVGPIIDESEE